MMRKSQLLVLWAALETLRALRMVSISRQALHETYGNLEILLS